MTTPLFNVVIGYERFARVRNAFLKHGYNAVSIDLEDDDLSEPNAYGGPHLRGDFWTMLESYCQPYEAIGLLIVFPVCTFVCGSGWHLATKDAARHALAMEWAANAKRIMALPCKRIVLENPIGILSRPEWLGKPTQIVQPWQFGHDASKATCLWSRGVPLLQPTRIVAPRIVEWPKGSGVMRKRWANQTDSGQNKLGPSADRAALRGKTYQGIADALADQYGRLLTVPSTPVR